MACLLLQLSLAMPLKQIISLQCDLDKLTALHSAGAVLEPSKATDCASLESLLHNDNKCDNHVTIAVGGEEVQAYRLYNSTYGENLLQLATFGMSGECQCPLVSFDGCKARCSDLNALRTINSARRSDILLLHEVRTKVAEQAKQRQLRLIKAAQLILNNICASYKTACEFAETLVSASALT